MAGVLLTGGAGLVGGATLSRLLQADPDTTVYCVLRAADDNVLQQRRAALVARYSLDAVDHRVVALAGDVEHPDLGLTDPAGVARRVDVVVHAAASTRFDLSLDAARSVNVGAIHNVVDFAQRMEAVGSCRRLHHLSTAFVAGDAEGVVYDPPIEPIGPFRNTYEQSKWEAEQVARRAADRLPVTISRPSIVVGDSRTGATPHFRVLYEPMKWVYFNNRSDGAKFSEKRTDVLPCRAHVRLDVVPVDHVADALVGLTFSDAAIGGTYHVSAGPARSLTIEQTIDVMLEAGNRFRAAAGKPPIPRPTIVSPEMLAESEELRQVFELGEQLMAAYMPYALREQLFDPGATEAVLRGALPACPDPRDYYPVLVEYATAHNYGRARA